MDYREAATKGSTRRERPTRILWSSVRKGCGDHELPSRRPPSQAREWHLVSCGCYHCVLQASDHSTSIGMLNFDTVPVQRGSDLIHGIGQTNCLTEIFIERALERAARLDEYFKKTGKTTGPLHGMNFCQ